MIACKLIGLCRRQAFAAGAFLLSAILAPTALAQTVTASNGLSCAGARGGNLNCTAGEFTATVAISKAPGAPDTCVAGEYFYLNATIGLSGSNANRYNIGFFTGEDGNDPKLAGGTCSVATFPTGPSPWLDLDSNVCGDYLKAGASTPLVQNLSLKCIPDVSGQLQVPYVVTYQQNSGTCSGPGDVTNGAPSKCNSGTSTVSGIWVMPTISINDGVTTVASGSAVTYTVVLSNPTAVAMNSLVFKDPLVSGIALSGVTCIASGGATCPASPTVAALQGSGLTVSLPAGGQLTFSLSATLTGSEGSSLTNVVSMTRPTGQSVQASDTDVISSATTAGPFNAIDDAYGTPPLGASAYVNRRIYMKLVGVPFRLNIAALSGNTVNTGYVTGSATKNVTVKLVDNSDNACVLDSAQANYCSASCRAKSAVAGGSQTLTFSAADSGQKQSANFTLNTAWKKLAVVISDGTASACATDSFSVRPTAITSLVTTVATNGNDSGTPVLRAGSDGFDLTATIAGVANNAAGYIGELKIDNTVLQPVSPATVAGTVAPAVFPAATSFSGASTATGSTFTYSEAGNFALPGYDPASDATSARGVYDDSWADVDSAADDCVTGSYSNTKSVAGKYGCNFGLIATTTTFGRFIPHEFRVSGVVLTNRQAAACSPASAFSYLDEAMGLQFTLEALAGGGNVTKNYAGTLAKLALPALTPSTTSGASLAFGAAGTTPTSTGTFAPLSSRLSATGFAGSWPASSDAAAGTVALSGTVTVSSLNTPANNRVSPDGPFSGVQIGIAPVDADGVKILSYNLDVDNSGGVTGPDRRSLNPMPTPPATAPAPTTLYFGQMRFWPAHGSELQPLAVNAEILRWNGTAFVPNGDDSCTRLPQANEGLRDYFRNLNSGETAITSGNLAFASGKGRIALSAPGSGNNGSVNVWGNLAAAGLDYLFGRWPALPGVSDATPTKYDNPPWATATFGIYKGQWIDMRENYFY